MFDTPHYISMISSLNQHIHNIFGESSSWSIPHLMIPSRIICVSVTLSKNFIVFPIPTDFSTHHGDATFPWWSSGIHPFFSRLLQFSKSQLLQRSGRPTRPRSARTTSAPHPAGDASKKRIHQTSAYDGYKMVIWCLYLYHIWCLYDVLIIFNMFINHFEWTCGCMFNDTIRCIHSSMSYPVKVHCHVQLPEGSLLSRYVLVLMTFPR